MCGSYELKAKVRELNRRLPRLHLGQSEMPRHGEFRPKDPVLMITSHGAAYLGCQARWGLVGSFLDREPHAPLLSLNGEGLACRPFYSKILKANRCLIPATAFHEWQATPQGRQKIRISDAKGEVLIFAGVFDHHPLAGTTCAILTGIANASVRHIQERMPIILDREESGFWLSEHADFPDAEFNAILRTPSRLTLMTEAVIEEEQSPQLSLAFA